MCAKPTGKIYYTMGEVTEMFDVNPSLIRFWESKFDILKPHKNKKGNRLFTPADIDNLKLIYHLVKEKGMTLTGAAQQIKVNRQGLSRDLEVVDRLLAIRAMLAEIRQELKMGPGLAGQTDEQDIAVPDIPDAERLNVAQRTESVPAASNQAETDFTFLADELDEASLTEEGFADEEFTETVPDEMAATAWDLQQQPAPVEEVPVQKIVAETIVDITGEELHEEYIGELSEEIAEEAATAAEVMETIAELEKANKKAPEAFEQTLF